MIGILARPWRRFLVIAGLAAGSWAISHDLSAHSDPVGDIHPEVVVENGRFAVYFRNNEGPHLMNLPHPGFRIIYEKDGSLTAPRHSVKADRFRHRYPVLMGEYFRKSPDGLKFTFPRGWQSYEIQRPDGSRVRRRLPWPNGGLGEGERQFGRANPGDAFDIFEDFAVGDTHLGLLGSDAKARDLQVVLFRRESLEAPVIVKLGRFKRIYNFPTCSNLVYAKGRFRVAWMEPTEQSSRLMFASIEPSGKFTKRALDLPADWNSHLSLAAIDDRICLAYHFGRGGGWADSRIITWFEKLEN